MAPCRFLFPILEKIYPVFDPCKSWGLDEIPRSAGACGTMSTNKYLPYLTYIYLGDLWQHAGLNKQISCRSTSPTSTTVHITSYLIVNVSPKNIQLTLSVNDYDYSLRIPLRSHHQTKHLSYGTLEINYVSLLRIHTFSSEETLKFVTWSPVTLVLARMVLRDLLGCEFPNNHLGRKFRFENIF